jgi:hypothetical protein
VCARRGRQAEGREKEKKMPTQESAQHTGPAAQRRWRKTRESALSIEQSDAEAQRRGGGGRKKRVDLRMLSQVEEKMPCTTARAK